MKQINRILVSAVAIIAVAAVPALAQGPDSKPDHPAQAKGPQTGKSTDAKAKAKAKRCKTLKKAYVASGVVEAAALTKNADGTYDGTLTVAVAKTNRHGKDHKGTSQTYTLDDARVSLPDADGNGTVDAADALPGQTAKVIGKITVPRKKHCDTAGFTATVTVRKVTLRAPAAPEQETAAPTAS
jgi:hypothetical protein